MALKQTPSQTVGPFFAYCLTPQAYGNRGIADHVLSTPGTVGEHVRIEGQLLDGNGEPVPDALIEIWQANHHGRYAHPDDGREDVPLDPGFRGFGRAGTDERGRYRFETVKPGRVPGRGNALQAPHVNLVVFARGMLSHAFTRIYFADEADANADDPTLALVDEARRDTLVAPRRETPGGPVYEFDIHLQGDHETVFFDA